MGGRKPVTYSCHGAGTYCSGYSRAVRQVFMYWCRRFWGGPAEIFEAGYTGLRGLILVRLGRPGHILTVSPRRPRKILHVEN